MNTRCVKEPPEGLCKRLESKQRFYPARRGIQEGEGKIRGHHEARSRAWLGRSGKKSEPVDRGLLPGLLRFFLHFAREISPPVAYP